MRATAIPAAAAIFVAVASLAAAQMRSDRPPPLDAVTTIVGAFRDHAVVAIDEPHGDERAHAFRLSLLRDPRFASTVNDILVEFGNSRYQQVIDRFVAGGDVGEDALRRVWQDTTQAHAIWDRPIYEAWFRAVRALNATLPSDRRLRVLLGDPPIDWEAIRTADDLTNARRRLPGRSDHPADVLLDQTLSKHRRALVIYGGLHLIRQNVRGPNLIERVERASGTRAFVVLTHPLASLDALGADPASWSAPCLALTAGSSLANQADAVLYLGPDSGRTTSRLSRSLCADAHYREMRIRRMTLAGLRDAPQQLDNECASAR